MLTKIWFFVVLTTVEYMDRKQRSSVEQFRNYFLFYMLAMSVSTFARGYFDLLSTTRIGESANSFEIGFLPLPTVPALLAAAVEAVILHVPFYCLCMRRLNDINYGWIRSLAVLVLCIVPVFGIFLFSYFFMIKKGCGEANRFGTPPLAYSEILNRQRHSN